MNYTLCSKSLRESLSTQAHKALLNLAVAHEVKTGQRLLWRRDSDALFQMVAESLSHRSYKLKKRAILFLKALSPEQQALFIARDIQLPKRKPSLMKRVSVLTKVPHASANNAA